MPVSERDGKLDPTGPWLLQAGAPTGYTVTTFIEIRDDAGGQSPGQDQATQQQVKASASPTQAIIE